MKIKISKGPNPLADLFAAPPSIEGEAEYHKLIFVEELLTLMKAHGISRIELARRMEIQPSRVTSMLSGSNNFTIETMVRAARAVNAKLHHKLAPATHNVSWHSWDDSIVYPDFRMETKAKKELPEITFQIPDLAYDDPAKAA